MKLRSFYELITLYFFRIILEKKRKFSVSLTLSQNLFIEDKFRSCYIEPLSCLFQYRCNLAVSTIKHPDISPERKCRKSYK